MRGFSVTMLQQLHSFINKKRNDITLCVRRSRKIDRKGNAFPSIQSLLIGIGILTIISVLIVVVFSQLSDTSVSTNITEQYTNSGSTTLVKFAPVFPVWIWVLMVVVFLTIIGLIVSSMMKLGGGNT